MYNMRQKYFFLEKSNARLIIDLKFRTNIDGFPQRNLGVEWTTDRQWISSRLIKLVEEIFSQIRGGVCENSVCRLHQEQQ